MTFDFEKIQEHQEVTSRYQITRREYEAFLQVFGDTNQLHVDDAYAAKHGFAKKIMHGGILNGFVSHFIGMVFPAGSAIILSSEIRFLKPNYLGDRIQVCGKIRHKSQSQRTLFIQLTISNETQGLISANGNIQIKML